MVMSSFTVNTWNLVIFCSCFICTNYIQTIAVVIGKSTQHERNCFIIFFIFSCHLQFGWSKFLTLSHIFHCFCLWFLFSQHRVRCPKSNFGGYYCVQYGRKGVRIAETGKKLSWRVVSFHCKLYYSKDKEPMYHFCVRYGNRPWPAVKMRDKCRKGKNPFTGFICKFCNKPYLKDCWTYIWR